MPDLASCRHCGASNPQDAEWCGQCFGVLSPEAATEAPAVVAVTPTRRGWECRSCGEENAVADSFCHACGTSIYDSYGARRESSADREAAVRRSFIFPGFGYGSLNLAGIGAVAGFLAIASLVVGAMLLVAGELVGLVLLAAFAALWAVSILDVARLSRGERVPLLRPRTLSFVGGLVVVLLLVTVAVAFQSATP
jgi:ribosomal protein L40E